MVKMVRNKSVAPWVRIPKNVKIDSNQFSTQNTHWTITKPSAIIQRFPPGVLAGRLTLSGGLRSSLLLRTIFTIFPH